MKTLQLFSNESLQRGKEMSTEEVARFLEDFRLLYGSHSPSKLISIKVPEPLLNAFRTKCRLENIKYQTNIKQLMDDWVRSS